MQRPPEEELRRALSVSGSAGDELDNQTVLRNKKALAEEFRNQLTIGAPTNSFEASLRRLSAQLRAGKVVVKLFLRHTLHAKLYLLYREDPINLIVAFLGSSNLTFSGLSRQGELNVDVLDSDAGIKLEAWFKDRWDDRWCVDIIEELIQVIDESWAREEVLPPYHSSSPVIDGTIVSCGSTYIDLNEIQPASRMLETALNEEESRWSHEHYWK